MTTTLRAFLDERETSIKGQLKALRAELAEIKVARQALDVGSIEVTSATNSAGPTIKEMVRRVLESAPLGMTSNDILASIKAEFSKEIERTSLSPQLSRLKSEGEVVLVNDNWYLRSHWEARLQRDARLEPDPDLEREAAMEHEAFEADDDGDQEGIDDLI